MCDWIFLAADSYAARHWVNTAVHQYLIPATQVGVKIPVNHEARDVGQIHGVTRLFLPGDGCMWCNQLIDPTQLAIDMHPATEREAARYVATSPPSVIALNTLAAAEAVNTFMLAVTGLHNDDTTRRPSTFPETENEPSRSPAKTPTAPGANQAGLLGRGDVFDYGGISAPSHPTSLLPRGAAAEPQGQIGPPASYSPISGSRPRGNMPLLSAT